MKVLIVCSGKQNKISPFVADQVMALNTLDITTEYFTINSKGILGYLKCLPRLLNHIKKYNPNLIHAHYGLSGLLAVLQRKLPVVVTYHGSDVRNKRVRPLSWLASRLSTANIFVAKEMLQLMPSPNSFVIPCGVDMELFKPIKQSEARKEFVLNPDKKYILFASGFDNAVKNYPLAKEAVSLLKNKNIELLELKGFSRIQVSHIMNATDMVLITSFTEGSPQFVKEAMTCNRPIVSTDVGDVRWLFGDSEGHFITSYDVNNVLESIEKALAYCKTKKSTQGRQRIIDLELDSESIAKRLIALYNQALKID
jgi:teichuronic acid biosynthesis glycosyltransferase TuaC